MSAPSGGERSPIPVDVESIAAIVVDAGLRVHRTLGPGLLESVYESCLVYELKKQGLDPRRQVNVPIVYDGHQIETNLRIDLLVNGAVIVEVKSIELFLPVHQSQLLTYLRLSGCRVGFLMNFNVRLFKEGVRRLVV